MKQVIAGVAAVTIAAAVLYFGRTHKPMTVEPSRDGPAPAAAATGQTETRKQGSESERVKSAIEAAVWALLDAANQGNAAAYADLLTGPLHDRFLETKREEGGGKGLERSFFGVKGIAVMAPQSVDGETWTVEVEFQYADRKEGQQFGLRRVGGQWRFARIEPARPLKQAIPYGTPVDAVSAGPAR